MRTRDEIMVMVKSMEALRPKIRPFNAFGDDNLAQFDVALKVVKGELTENDINDITNPEQNSAGQNALEWLRGEDVEFPPDEDWPLKEV